MAKINFTDGSLIAEYLDNKWPFTGYVLDFVDSTFDQFFSSELGIDIRDEKYHKYGGAKGKRLRAFFEIESDKTVGKALMKLGQYFESKPLYTRSDLKEKYYHIARRLIGNNSLDGFEETIVAVDDTEYWHEITRVIKNDISEGKCEIAIDRLHTYFHQYFRKLLTDINISFDQDDRLETLYGKYRDYLTENNYATTEMSQHILKTQTSILQKYNHVRNNNSFAHPNPLLNKLESEFIVGQLINIKKFLDGLIQQKP